jgi:gamma-glutamyltranspeptidase/glutathione hydrolase
VNSNHLGFGSGLVPDVYALQNRELDFRCKLDIQMFWHWSKRPYHVDYPRHAGRTPDTGDGHHFQHGGDMQPQGHMQLTVDMIAGGLDPASKRLICLDSVS